MPSEIEHLEKAIAEEAGSIERFEQHRASAQAEADHYEACISRCSLQKARLEGRLGQLLKGSANA